MSRRRHRDPMIVRMAEPNVIGAVQFEWEAGAVAVEAIVEPEGGFTVYIHRGSEDTEECSPVEVGAAVEAVQPATSA